MLECLHSEHMRDRVICILNLCMGTSKPRYKKFSCFGIVSSTPSSVFISPFCQPLFSLFNCFGQAMSSFSLSSSLELMLSLTHRVAACLALSPESAISPNLSLFNCFRKVMNSFSLCVCMVLIGAHALVNSSRSSLTLY